MKIKINLNIFLFLILFILTNQIEIYALTMLFALIHEMGHLLMGIVLNYQIDSLKIIPLGFTIEFKIKIEEYNKKILKTKKVILNKILIAIAGPITNLIMIIFLLILKVNNVNLIFANLIIIIFNMIPIYPLDGGRILLNSLKLLIGNKKAYTYSNIISNLFVISLTGIASIAIYYYKNIAILVVIATIWGLVIKENKKYKIYHKIYQTIDKETNYL